MVKSGLRVFIALLIAVYARPSLAASQFYVDGANGNVGIGTSAPVDTLDIGTAGGVHITSGPPPSTSMVLYNNSGTLTWNGLNIPTGTGGGGISGTANYVPLYTTTTSLGVSSIYQSTSAGTNGYLGIGTANPLSSFQVNGTTSIFGVFTIGTNTPASTNVGVDIKADTIRFGKILIPPITHPWVSAQIVRI